jgi:hypothetical protein
MITPRLVLVPFALAPVVTACVSPADSAPNGTVERGPLGKADAAGSCAAPDGGDFCGGPSDGACWCDDLCSKYGDCCPDKPLVCDCDCEDLATQTPPDPTCEALCHPVTCGDGVIGGSEACDGDDLGGQSCPDFGFTGGALGCAADCQIDTSACTSAPSCASSEHVGGTPQFAKHGAAILTSPSKVVSGDFVAGGGLDLVAFDKIAEKYHIVGLVNDGSGTFTPVSDQEEVYYAYELASGDLDGDGNIDLAFLGGSGPITRLLTILGDGAGGWGTRTNHPAFGFARDLELADLDADGDLDVAISDSTHLSVRLNDGTGALGAEAAHTLAFSAGYRMDVADMNGDGALDLLAAHERTNGGATIIFGHGDGTFDGAGQQYVLLEKHVGEIVAPDLDADGDADVVYTTWNTPKVVGVKHGLGDGALEPTSLQYTVGGARPRRIDSADFNCDGVPDIAATSDSGSTGAGVNVYPGDGGGLLGDRVYTAMYGLLDAEFADLDGDGLTDIAAVRTAHAWFGDPAAHEVTIYLGALAD